MAAFLAAVVILGAGLALDRMSTRDAQRHANGHAEQAAQAGAVVASAGTDADDPSGEAAACIAALAYLARIGHAEGRVWVLDGRWLIVTVRIHPGAFMPRLLGSRPVTGRGVAPLSGEGTNRAPFEAAAHQRRTADRERSPMAPTAPGPHT